jgi:hypothetical protein
VTCVIPSLESGDPTDLSGELVNHLPFPFITPLCTEHHCGWHDGRALQTIHEPAHDQYPLHPPILKQQSDDFNIEIPYPILRM